MAITRGTLRIARRLRSDIGVEVDAVDRTLTAAWVRAWDDQAGGWRTAASDLVAEAGRLDHWPWPTDIARLPSVMAALDRAETALAGLAKTAAEEAALAAGRVIDLDVEREPGLIASQAPTTERAALLGHVTGRLVVAEQDRDSLRLAVLSRIRTDAVGVIRRRAEGQITSDLLPLSADAGEAMRRELIRGVDVGANPREAAARMLAQVEGAFNGGLSRALTVSRTEILDAYRATSQQIYAANSDVVPGWQWLSELDSRCCPSCWSMHGQQFPAATPGPDDHQRGRCARTPVLASWAELGISAPEPPSVMVDAQALFDRLPEASKLAVMGPARLGLYRSGQIRWTDLATRRLNPGWRQSYVPTPVRTLRRSGRPAAPVLRQPTIGRDLTGELDLAALDRQVVSYTRLRTNPGQGDQVLGQIQQANGFNGLPQLVSAAEMDALVAAGRQPLYRGIQPRFVEPFKTGDHYPGLGVAGNGTYTTINRDYALDYAKRDEAGVMRMVLHPDARTTTIEDIEREMVAAGFRPSRVGQQTLVDQGRWAAAHGYDAYRVPVHTRENEEYWVILNRTAVVVER